MIITSLTAAVILILAGALIWRFKLVTLIAGNRSDRQTDKEGLARWIGKSMITMGIVVFVFAALQYLIFQDTYIFVDTAIIVALSIRMARGAAKFSKPISAKAAKKISAKQNKGTKR